MSELRAFVGHSFVDSDRDVVRVFLEHFDSLSKANLSFSWDHAEEAAPAPLSEKVLSKISGKNVFIGICTRKERVAPDTAFTRALLRNGLVKAKAESLAWKTSDWIIQEIGLAVGRGMKVILFIEEGVRDPGGLQGDTEYIPFSRENPQKSFDKFLEMLTSISPRPSGSLASQTKSDGENEKENASASEDDLEPRLNWSRRDYNFAAFRLILRSDAKRFEQVDSAYKKVFSSADEILNWDAQNLFYRVAYAEGDLEKLRLLFDENPTSSKLAYFLAKGYESYSEHLAAARMFERASELSESQEDKIGYLGDAAAQFQQAGSRARSIEIVEDLRKFAESRASLTGSVLRALQKYADITKDDLFRAVLMEGQIESDPGDVDIRFKLAYAHSQIKTSDMALYHYVQIPLQRRSRTTWNNLGVSFGEFGMPAKSVAAFQNAAQEKETLAMSNLGFKLLSIGFLNEAQTLCDSALSIPEFSNNIPVLLKSIKDVPEAEEKKLVETIDGSLGKRSFFRKLGEKIALPTPQGIADKWQSTNCVLSVTKTENVVRMVGAYEVESSALGGLLGLGLQIKVTQTDEYVGKLNGRVFVGHVKRSRDGSAKSLLDLVDTKVLMFFSDDETKLSVIENYTSSSPKFYDLIKLS